ncbi:MAG: hypothetical protein LBE99_04070, partial [Puniceicoccales bacterium]|nr:hypothetical protein [Puniceicoccales bacterium]
MAIPRSPSFSSIHSPALGVSALPSRLRANESPDSRISHTLGQLFYRLGLQVGTLANRFYQMGVTPDQAQQIAQMLTLPEDIQPPTYNVQGVRTPYEPVPPHRLLEVIS